jgi:predicted PurR-regulated permease PerM
MPRWAAVLAVIVCGLAVAAGFLAAAIPPLANEAAALAHQIPHYMHDLQNRNSQLGKLNVRYHIQVGALIAIPVAAAVRLLLQEIAFRRLDQS